MNRVLKPKIFNDDNVFESVKDAVKNNIDETRAAMLRAEAASRFLRFFILLILWAVLLKDIAVLHSLKNITVLNGLDAFFSLIGNLISEIILLLSLKKLYYFSLIAVILLIMRNPSIFHFIFMKNYSALYKKGIKYMQKEKYDEAAVLFTKALKNIMPQSEKIKISCSLCECYYNECRYEECIKTGLETLELDGSNDRAFTFIGKSFLRMGERGGIAVKYYIHLFDKGAGDKVLLDILSSHFLSENDLSETAVRVYKNIYEKSPHDAQIREMVYRSCVITNDRSNYAIKLYEELLFDEPSRKDVKLALASAYYEAKNYRKAVEIIRMLFDSGEFSKKLLEIYYESINKLKINFSLYDEMLLFMNKFPDNKILADFFDSMKTDLMAGRLVKSGIENSRETHGVSVNKVNICASCAHMNPAGISHCEKCRRALNLS